MLMQPDNAITFYVFSVGKHLLTKKPHIFDPCGDRDKDDVMHEYKDAEGNKFASIFKFTSQHNNLDYWPIK